MIDSENQTMLTPGSITKSADTGVYTEQGLVGQDQPASFFTGHIQYLSFHKSA